MVHQLLHHRLGVGEGDQAVADVAGRLDAQLAAEAPGTPAVVGHGHDGGDVVGVVLDAPDEAGQAASAADDGDSRPGTEDALQVQGLQEAAAAGAAGETVEGECQSEHSHQCAQCAHAQEHGAPDRWGLAAQQDAVEEGAHGRTG